jgi:hypothetical protein
MLMLFDTSYACSVVHIVEFEIPSYCLCFRKSDLQRRSRPASSVRAFNCTVGGTAWQTLVLRYCSGGFHMLNRMNAMKILNEEI